MPRVLVLCEYPSLNGGEWSLLSLLDGVRSAGFEILVAAPPTGPLAEQLAQRRVRLVPLCLRDAASNRLAPDGCRDRIRRAMAQAAPDLVHANSVSMSRLSGPVAAESRMPSIGHLRDMIRLSAGAIADLNCHVRLLAVSDATRDWYVSLGLDAAKTHVVYNGVDLDRFRPRPSAGRLHRQLHLPAGVPIVGAIGQIGMRKGLDVWIEAARTVASRMPEVHFAVVGKRYSQKQEAVDYEDALLDAAASSPLAGRVHFLGRRDDVPLLLNEFVLLVHAARQEPLGRVLLEAAASATPVVATAVGGTPEIFPRGADAAVLVPPDDPETLALAILRLLPDGALRRQLGAAARHRVEEKFDARHAATALAEVYRQVR